MRTETLSVAAPFIIQQNYAVYTDEQHAVWSELVGRVLPELEKHAAREYLDGGKGMASNWEQYVQALLLANEFVFVD